MMLGKRATTKPQRLCDEQVPPPKRVRTKAVPATADKPARRSKAHAEDPRLHSLKASLPLRWRSATNGVAEFFEFVYKRQVVWQSRSDGEPQPWTQDKLLQRYNFCNVYRELDRGTIYFRAEVKKARLRDAVPLSTEDLLGDVLWRSVVYRLMNKIETFEAWGKGIPSPQEFGAFEKFLRKQRQHGATLFTSAHQVIGFDRYVGTLKSVHKQLPTFVRKLREQRGDAKACFEILRGTRNVGPFFAWQILCDLLEEPGLLAPGLEDQWVQLGPGAQRGLRRAFGTLITSEAEQLEGAQLLARVQHDAFACLGIDFPFYNGR